MDFSFSSTRYRSGREGSLFLQALDGCVKPVLEDILHFFLGFPSFECVYRLSQFIEWDVMAGHARGAALHWDKLHQETLAARMAPFGIAKIQAGQRILKN